MKILFFDTETTEVTRPTPRIIQMGWILADQAGQVLNKQTHLIRPNGWLMPTGPFWVNNGFAHTKSMREGVPIDYVLGLFHNDHTQADLLVAHNISFDLRILFGEYGRLGRVPAPKMEFCTMNKTTSIARIPGKKGYKRPTLAELYRFLFEKEMEDSHKADADVAVTMECFFELVNRKLINL
jgi:DNA polymerase-3 subunit epsilon